MKKDLNKAGPTDFESAVCPLVMQPTLLKFHAKRSNYSTVNLKRIIEIICFSLLIVKLG